MRSPARDIIGKQLCVEKFALFHGVEHQVIPNFMQPAGSPRVEDNQRYMSLATWKGEMHKLQNSTPWNVRPYL